MVFGNVFDKPYGHEASSIAYRLRRKTIS